MHTQLNAYDNHGIRVLDSTQPNSMESTQPGSNDSIANVTLNGNSLSWAHNGTSRQATLS